MVLMGKMHEKMTSPFKHSTANMLLGEKPFLDVQFIQQPQTD